MTVQLHGCGTQIKPSLVLYEAFRPKELDGEAEWLLNSVTLSQGQRALAKSGTQSVLYFMRDSEVPTGDRNGIKEVAVRDMLNKYAHDKELQKLLNEYQDVFK